MAAHRMTDRAYARITRRLGKAFARSFTAAMALGCAYVAVQAAGQRAEGVDRAFAFLAACIGTMLFVTVAGLVAARLQLAARRLRTRVHGRAKPQ